MTITIHRRALYGIGKAIAFLICEPQLRVGRRRHDDLCDRCGEAFDRYSMEKLDFPDVDIRESSRREKIRSMLNAEYVRVCLECSGKIENEEVADE